MISEAYLDELDALLLNRLEDGMLLSELDGFLTGLIVSPDPVPQSRWLKLVWGDGPTAFEDQAALQTFLDLLMRHHNQIIADLDRPGEYEPVLEVDTRTDETLWEMWIEGFAKAMTLASGGWNRIRAGDDEAAQAAIAGITLLAGLISGRIKLDEVEEDHWDREAPGLIPLWVQVLHAWRLAQDGLVNSAKIGRNDPCPCGSGKKYKKCCGLN
ncbi:UPF0149 family protein [Sphingomonas oligophenolica]|uniref:YecA family protein n=1 Tax=Sphingomonas oligophenolica TaxID=301154 RepID=A0A502CKP7_9SPHN|nr:UPF0149 family protein [Sphingomonas oligophenolica]TPG13194.1 YecA family protein [Sphingomonas oligophenolica]